MKIKANVLQAFLEKISMNNAVSEGKFDFGKEGLSILTMSGDSLVMIEGKLASSAFTVYESIGEVGLTDLTTIKKLLTRFTSEITIEVKGNTIKFLEGKKSVEFTTKDVKFIETPKGFKVLDYADGTVIKIFSAEIKNFIGDGTSVINTSDYKLTFLAKDNMVEMRNLGKYKFSNIIEGELQGENNAPATVSFGLPFLNAITGITGDIVISLKNDFPITVREETTESSIRFLVAPIVLKDD